MLMKGFKAEGYGSSSSTVPERDMGFWERHRKGPRKKDFLEVPVVSR